MTDEHHPLLTDKHHLGPDQPSAGDAATADAATTGAATVDAGSPALRLPAHRVAPKARLGWLIGAIIGWLFLIAPEAVVIWLADSARPWSVWVLVGTLVVAVAHCAVMPEWRFRVHRWEVDDEAVYTRTGWITQSWRIAPVSRVQTVDSSYGPIQRILGLGSLKVTTASSAGAVEIDGLAKADVERLVARLTTVTARDPGDAT